MSSRSTGVVLSPGETGLLTRQPIRKEIEMKFPGGMNLQQMMKQAQKMQEQMAQEMQALRVDATAGGGIIKVVMSGSKELLSIKIEPDAAGDVEMLEDLIIAAVNECSRKIDEAMQDKLGGALGGLKIPGLS